MFTHVRDELRAQLEEIRGGGALQAGACDRHAANGEQ